MAVEIGQADLVGARRLIELSDEEFAERFDCDRFTASVLAGRYRYIVDHMCGHLLTNAFSPILRDWYDFAATVSGPPKLGYPMSAVSNSLLNFLGTMGDAVRNSVQEFGPENLRPGDVLLCNDPYRIGTHVNDFCYVRPAFAEGEIVGLIALQAHMLDAGGSVPGGFSGTKQSLYENGLVLGPQLLYREDESVRGTFSLIFDNARFGPVMMADIQSIHQNLKLGERLLLESVERYGTSASLGAMRYVTDRSADAMARALETIPDGEYRGSDLIDCDGVDDSEEYRIQVKITVHGERAEVDLSGTSRQARTSINAGWLDVKTAVSSAFKYLLDPETPFSSGTLRNVDIAFPMGTFVSAMPPEGPIFCYYESSGALLNAIFRALADVLGADAIAGDYGSGSLHSANGSSPDGTPWMSMGSTGGEHGPWGATRHGDAESSMAMYLANTIAPAVEAIESDGPVVVMRKEYVTDSSGAGTHRGGASVRKDSLWLMDAQHYSMPLHVKTTSGFGVFGGADGALGAVWKFDPDEEAVWVGTDDAAYRGSEPVAGMLDPGSKVPDAGGEYFYFARVPIWRTEPGAVFRYQTGGGGGWGDPFERDPQQVLIDVRDEYVSVEAARRDFGVVVKGDPELDPLGLSVDADETAAIRAQHGS